MITYNRRSILVTLAVGLTGITGYYLLKSLRGHKGRIQDLIKILKPTSSCNSDNSSCSCGDSLKVKTAQSNKLSVVKRDHENNKVPGIGRIMMRNFGCNHNRSDSESMNGLLVEYGYEIVNELDDCDLIVINSCTVKGPSEMSCKNLVETALNKKKFVVVTGCIPQAERTLPWLKNVSVLGVSYIHRIVEIVELTLQGNIVEMISMNSDLSAISTATKQDKATSSRLPPLSLPKIRRNSLVEIITVSVGCLGNCTYCKTKYSRGNLGSYTIETILNRVKTSLKEGIKQIWLTSEDTGAYGKDIGTNLSSLIYQILNIIPPDVMIRIGMTNPPYILNQIQDMVEVLSHPNVFEFLHIPVQSGSNKVLTNMRRDYTREDFCKLVDEISNQLSLITIATDIICGFPGETEEDHQDTVELIKKYKFPVINISKFYPRPGTPAAKMKAVPNGISKRRSLEITNIFHSLKHNEELLEKLRLNTKYNLSTSISDIIVRVWFIENSDISIHTIGHTKQYTKVIVEKDDKLLGKVALVKLIKPERWHFEGEVISLLEF
ncbi:radical SAM domain-containing protein [Cryptosporidium andersoni]|uniref:Threonylcarbamoyladenosine tRNA methylthiotransferase n=1 Tax=Cryptosporidium andersoni TaxID=117008 RepID=A0A1J4MPB2_9CRYT|nr:radical SAM domain-containing protein [Cryptosporidium andersoni]